jgi:hypothetical protein
MSAPWDDMVRLIYRVWSTQRAITTKSDLSRELANEIAEATAKGFITTMVFPGLHYYGNHLKVTLAGLRYMEEVTADLKPHDLQELLGFNAAEETGELPREDRSD